MKLNLQGIQERSTWERTGIRLPSYDVEALLIKTIQNPAWVHFGCGNIFRSFLGKIADSLLSDGAWDTGLTCIETYDAEIVDRIYTPHDNLALNVILFPDGHQEKQVLGCFSEALCADAEHRERLR